MKDMKQSTHHKGVIVWYKNGKQQKVNLFLILGKESSQMEHKFGPNTITIIQAVKDIIQFTGGLDEPNEYGLFYLHEWEEVYAMEWPGFYILKEHIKHLVNQPRKYHFSDKG